MTETAIQGTAAEAAALELLLEQSFAARLGALKRMRGSVHDAARRCGFDEDAAGDIVLAVDEACKNVIVHAYANAGGEIVISIHRDRTGIVVRVRDFAPAIDPARVKPRDLSDVRPGQLGTHFIREIMDSTEFLPAPDGVGNLLQMTKRRD